MLLQINSVPYGSTATIMVGLHSVVAKKAGPASSVTSAGYSTHPMNALPNSHRQIGSFFEKLFHLLFSRATGIDGRLSLFAIKRFLSKHKEASLIHLHNLHGYYLNLPYLFRYIKKHRIPVVWTLHDCWAFTGHCPHFTMAKCDKWKTGCHHCPQYREYPQSLVDNSRWMYRWKKKWFTGVEDMTIVTPSQWLADLVKESFLKDYPVKVIHNGIDLKIFKPTPSDFRERYEIPAEKSVLLGVAFGWGKRKGLDVFVELARRLEPEKYQIVLVGTDEKTDKLLPENIISIHRTQNQTELAEIYTAVDLFVNPTREENYPTVNMESIACGTPVLTFRTGGSPEILTEKTGCVVPCDDIDALEQEILRICTINPFSQADCLEHAKSFDMHERFEEYVKLYEERSVGGVSV